MSRDGRQSGFSLLETMLAVGTLAVGMVFVAGTFMTGVYFASVATERTIATVVTDEAFAKIVLRGMDPNSAKTDGFVPYESIVAVDPNEFCYPSTSGHSGREYSWSAICRRRGADSHLVEFTVFVSRLVGPNARYWVRDVAGAIPRSTDPTSSLSLPRPVVVHLVPGSGSSDRMVIQDAVNATLLPDNGSVIVDDATGQIYRVMERYGTSPDEVRIDRPWSGAATGGSVWTVPRPVAGGRIPSVAVYQKVLRF